MTSQPKRALTEPKAVVRRPRRTDGFKELTRTIDRAVERELWTKAGGRCEFAGCNCPLWKSSVTQESVNVAQKAHIYSFSTNGPRGSQGIAIESLNSFENLLLVCHGCHQKIDKQKDGGRYSVALLRQWKAQHEQRIEIVTGIAPDKKSHVVLYGANIGDHSAPLNFTDAAHALFPHRYPADDRGIELGTVNSSFIDRSADFWRIEASNLSTLFQRRIQERVATGDISHLSVFAIAPQPLLILLGSLMIDITGADVFQLHREPQTWAWPSKAPKLKLQVDEPSSFLGPPALVLALTAPVTIDRITATIGDDASIWRVTVARPNNDLIKSPQQLSEFRTVIRELLDRIKARHGQTTPLHIFPVAGVSPAVELGRIRMPKAHMPWKIYDQVNACGGFIHALSLPQGN